jgi:MFS family permease
VRVLPERSERERWRPRRPDIPHGIRRQFAVAGAAAFVGWSVTGLFLALIPSFVTTVLRHDLVLAGGVVGLMLGCSAVTAVLANAQPSLPTQIAGIAVMGTGVAALLAAVQVHWLAALFLATVLAGVGQGLTFTGSLADVNELAPEDRKANVVASYYVVVYLGTALPVIGVGALAGPLGLESAIRIFAIVVLAVCVAGLVTLARWLRR